MIQISGIFNQQEITDAERAGATAEILSTAHAAGLSANLNFHTQNAYHQWLRDQQTQQPDRWSTLVHIKPNKPQ